MAEDTPTARPRLTHVVLGSPRPRELAEFYHRLLGWAYDMVDGDWVTLKAPEGAGLGFQLEDAHRRPVWPSSGDGAPSAAAEGQQMQLHLDFVVDDLEVAVAAATGLGAIVAEYQPQDDVRVMLDPDGHPFCLFT